MKNNMIKIRCDKDFLDKLEAICKVTKMTKSSVIRELVCEEYRKDRRYDQMYHHLELLKHKNN